MSRDSRDGGVLFAHEAVEGHGSQVREGRIGDPGSSHDGPRTAIRQPPDSHQASVYTNPSGQHELAEQTNRPSTALAGMYIQTGRECVLERRWRPRWCCDGTVGEAATINENGT